MEINKRKKELEEILKGNRNSQNQNEDDNNNENKNTYSPNTNTVIPHGQLSDPNINSNQINKKETTDGRSTIGDNIDDISINNFPKSSKTSSNIGGGIFDGILGGSAIETCKKDSDTKVSVQEKKYSCVELFDYTWYCLSPVSQIRSYYLTGNVDNCTDKISAWSMCMKGKFVTIPDLDNDIKEKLGFSHNSSSKVWPLKDKPGWY